MEQKVTLADAINTCSEIARTGGRQIQNLLKMKAPPSFMENAAKFNLRGDRFILVLSNDPAADMYGNDPLLGEFEFIVVKSTAEQTLVPLLALQACAVIIDSDLRGLALTAMAVLPIAGMRGIPVITHDFDDEKLPLLACHVTSDLLQRGDLHKLLWDMAPTSYWPFSLSEARDNTGSWSIDGVVPVDFLTEAPLGTPRFHYAYNRLIYLVARGKHHGKLLIGPRYYAALVGDNVMSIEDDDHKIVVSLMATPPKPNARSPHN
jgi:hypothetical protein